METRCPFLDCHHVFAIPADAQRVVDCHACLRSFSHRPLEAWTFIEGLAQKRIEKGLDKSALDANDHDANSMVCLLEDVRSLWNVGSIFRSADGAGFSKLLLCGITGSPPRKEIAKTSLGAEDSVPWQCYTHSLAVLTQLKAKGFMIVGLERCEGSTLLSDAITGGIIKRPLCLVVGNEVTGISQETLSMCDRICHLPMRGIKESLNVAVAFGIAAYLVSDGVRDKQQPILSHLSVETVRP
jgi:tRNA G18 (ribose-2'-O)-methylase SpoU